ncbi:hypothetical protein TTHERM_00590280 (macronuclear) [Tetrahymena thermophila SB210]|uniref:Uncharacterized protein n=1 Tax=Tetrahymena thermophila (strain SB210) TaxID=312017 RepID=I7MFE4_TETTS|nr:hypothetical protein TTHERM_00590280 [Tetrahymena thermophila SB210]EAR99690.2 hypothetical protein TTHERM_00590280 [Tetrahymena thermophila SB210]|eukprot:XP_001019935.2 hypothetical protein TTHERM_00590280 [Tetrahymena thermophila SB210]
MKEIRITFSNLKLVDKIQHYVPDIEGGYFLEIYYGSKRVTSKPFRVSNQKKEAPITNNLFIFNICGNSLDFILKSYQSYDFVASGQLKLDEVKDQEVVTIDLLVERVVFTRLSFGINVIENIIEKEVIVEKDEDCFKPPEPEIDLEEVRRKEEEERQKLLEEQEALRRAELNKNAITYTNIQVKDAPYY